ncbi:MAG: hypothetical protein FH762_03710 [Firmicutes bacterium]|nr:hypothetical protein [Bacillota bacterium]
MKITSKTYDILLNMINTNLETQEQEAINKTISNQDTMNNNPTTDNPSTLPADLENLLQNLDHSQKNKLFALLSKMNLPLSREQLLQLQTDSSNDTNTTQNARLAALNILISNRIPLLPVLISSLAETLDPESSLTNKINQILDSIIEKNISKQNLELKENTPSETTNNNLTKPETIAVHQKEINQLLDNIIEKNISKSNPELKTNTNLETEGHDIVKSGKNVVDQQISLSNKIKQLLDNIIKINVNQQNTELNSNTYLKAEETSFADKINQLLENILEKDNNKLNPTIKDIHHAKLQTTDLSRHNINAEKNTITSKTGDISREINKLLLKIDLPPDKLAQELEKYPETIKQSLQSLVNQTGEENLKTFNHLLGQQLINQQENILLNIEIPLMLPDSKKAVPFHLEIKKGKTEKEKNKQRKGKNYKIRFIISLEKRGTIMSDITYTGKKLSSSFYCDSKETCLLIKKYMPELKHNLAKSGIELVNFDIKQLDEKEEHKQSPILNSLELSLAEQSGEFIHIDFKV